VHYESKGAVAVIRGKPGIPEKLTTVFQQAVTRGLVKDSRPRRPNASCCEQHVV
jgi:hypothetical protein